MTAQIISGTEIAKQIREELKQEIAELKEKHNLVPGLVTVLVGEDPASQVYVGSKVKTCEALGVYSEKHDLPADTSEELDRLGLELTAIIPEDEEIYKYDLELKPLLNLPDASKAVRAINELMAKLLQH